MEFLKLFLVLIVPFIIAFLGYLKFKKQKEYENVRQRYLFEGFDKLISEYEYALSSYRYNWSIALAVLQQIRELPRDTINIKLLEDFISLKDNIFPTVSVHRLTNLMKIDDLWEKHQALYSFIFGTYRTFTCDFYVGAVSYAKNSAELKASGQEIYNQFFEIFKELNSKSTQFDLFLGAIKKLSTIFEENVFSKKDMHNFKNRDDVKKILSDLTRPHNP